MELQPNNSGFHRWLGRVYGQKAERATLPIGLALKTRDEFQRAAQLDPSDTDALIDVAEYYLEAPGIMGGGHDKARDEATRGRDRTEGMRRAMIHYRTVLEKMVGVPVRPSRERESRREMA